MVWDRVRMIRLIEGDPVLHTVRIEKNCLDVILVV